MIRPRFTTESQMAAYKGRRQLGYQFLDAVCVIAEPFPQLPVAAVRFGRPIAGFMRARAVVVQWSKERGKRRQCDRVGIGRVKCPIPLMRYPRIDAAEELLRGFDALLDGRVRVRFGCVTVHL